MPGREIEWSRIEKRVTLKTEPTAGNEFYFRTLKGDESIVAPLDDPTIPYRNFTDQQTLYFKLSYTAGQLAVPNMSDETRTMLARRRVLLEEYEVYDALDAAGKDLHPITRPVENRYNLYDPSNDMTRRLVFSCDLTEIETLENI
jgi:hypothetical protein